jgi:PAS domain S-box-containing protein
MENPAADSNQLITALERLGSHEHFCSIYENPEEHYAVAVPFIRIGIERGDKCVYIADDETEKAVGEAMQAGGIDVERALATHSLVLTTKEQAYLKHGSFDPEWIFTFWREAAGRAMNEGFAGLRATGETEWVRRNAPGLERWMEYESRLTDTLAESNCVALCQYNRQIFSSELILDVIRTHPTVVYRGTVGRNMYHVPADEFLGTDRTEREVERLLTSIRERERVENALRQRQDDLRDSEQRFRLMVEGAKDYAIFMLDTDGRVTGWNAAAERIKGYREEEIVGRHFSCFYLPGDVAEGKPERALKWAAATGRFEDEGWRVRKNGSRFWADIVVTAIRRGEGQLIGFSKVTRDITERKHAEEELHTVQAELARVSRVMTMGELTAAIAHEINQPLAAVVTNGNACLRWLTGAMPNLNEARDALGRIIRDANRASNIIGRIRGLLKRTGTEQEWLNLNEAIEDVIALAHSEVRRNGVTLQTELAGDLPPVLVDRVQLQQVVLNLMMNAIEAMNAIDDRTRELKITTGKDGPDKVRVAVQDSGIGLHPDGMNTIFEAFYTTKPHGMGIGLSISRSIVEAHGGRLWSARNEGPGATLQFTLPVSHSGAERPT